MKQISQIGLIAVFFIVLFACNKSEEPSLKGLSTLSDASIGFFENGKFVFTTPKASILEAAKGIDPIEEAGATPIDVQVEVINGKPYLRIYADNQSVSTVALLQPQNNNARKLNGLIPGKTICTSSDCSSGGGCVPNGSYCTECIKEIGPNGENIKGDCKRTTDN